MHKRQDKVLLSWLVDRIAFNLHAHARTSQLLDADTFASTFPYVTAPKREARAVTSGSNSTATRKRKSDIIFQETLGTHPAVQVCGLFCLYTTNNMTFSCFADLLEDAPLANFTVRISNFT